MGLCVRCFPSLILVTIENLSENNNNMLNKYHVGKIKFTKYYFEYRFLNKYLII